MRLLDTVPEAGRQLAEVDTVRPVPGREAICARCQLVYWVAAGHECDTSIRNLLPVRNIY